MSGGGRWKIVSVAAALVVLLAAAGAWGGRLLGADDGDRDVARSAGPTGTNSPSATAGAIPSRAAPSVTTVREYTPAEICDANGSGYRVVDTRKLKTSRGVVKGVFYLLYSDADGSHCAVTMEEKGLSKDVVASVAVHIESEMTLVNNDGGGTYAVMVSGKDGACVRWSAWVGTPHDEIFIHSKADHCGP